MFSRKKSLKIKAKDKSLIIYKIDQEKKIY